MSGSAADASLGRWCTLDIRLQSSFGATVSGRDFWAGGVSRDVTIEETLGGWRQQGTTGACLGVTEWDAEHQVWEASSVWFGEQREQSGKKQSFQLQELGGGCQC